MHTGQNRGKGRVLRLEKDGSFTEFEGGFGGPVTGLAWHEGNLYVAAGALGEEHGAGCGQIVRLSRNGQRETIVNGLRTCGDHYTGDVLFGPDGKLYFSVGTATNSAVVGHDNTLILKYHPDFHDMPARDITLTGTNFISPAVLQISMMSQFRAPINRSELLVMTERLFADNSSPMEASIVAIRMGPTCKSLPTDSGIRSA